MFIESAFFSGSFVDVRALPDNDLPEYAFIGRSNVGKSSLINMLTGRKKLAKTSNRPGKTQTINLFTINEDWLLVDLPGYGYAQISKTARKKWERFIRGYLSKRRQLQCVFLLIDSRIPPQRLDLDFAAWLGELHIPFVLVFTKADKLKPAELDANVETFRAAMLEEWNALPQQFITSSTSKQGRDEVLGLIQEVNQRFREEFPEVGN